MKTDLTSLREDYISGYSCRMLAAKYGVPKSTVSYWIKRYGWKQESGKQKYVKADDIPRHQVTELIDCTLDSSLDRPTEIVQHLDELPMPETIPPASEEYILLRQRARKVLEKADQLLDIDDALAPRDLKSLSSMLLDVRQLLNVLSPYEEEERRLRIALARKQIRDAEKSQAENEQTGTVVRFVDTEGAEE